MTECGSWYHQPDARLWRCAPPPETAFQYHRGLPAYRPTALVECPTLATELGVGRVFVKDESSRLGLGSFKVLGASWAVARLLAARTVANASLTVDVLRQAAAEDPFELVTATEGNHGRALAYVGRLLGLPVRVFAPDRVPAAAVAAIAATGAEVSTVAEPYDRVVDRAADYAAFRGRELVQDTAWPGYERVPGWIVAGYQTLLGEIDGQLRVHGEPGPDLVAAPVGVGSLAQAVVTHYRAAQPPGPAVLAVEPTTAAGLMASLRRGTPQSVPTTHTTMTGLNCGRLSSAAWPVLAAGLDAATAVDDQAAQAAVEDLASLGISSGPSGAASLAGVRAALSGTGHERRREELGLTSASTVVLLNTEGATNR
ncbi:diaminopropionate ammonia-lyase [Fodinicola acaciae]|uniref:diaminopropionate ammonia-lyase n=1 Tax=Fodinicola acaciae TaxID=2681555 RepID=UPI0013D3E9FE|nr:diaminopropionate ammonia-lyase [Fodinicola acaciae]